MRRRILPLILVACTTPEQRAQQALMYARCQSMEVFPDGARPDRPYHVVGAVQAQIEQITAIPFQVLKAQACAFGADAVIDVRELSSLGANTLEEARPGILLLNRAPRLFTGVAIRYDETQPTQPPPEAKTPELHELQADAGQD